MCSSFVIPFRRVVLSAHSTHPMALSLRKAVLFLVQDFNFGSCSRPWSVSGRKFFLLHLLTVGSAGWWFEKFSGSQLAFKHTFPL